jgi:hypothetical protein
VRELLIDYIPFQLTRQQIEESMAKNDGRLMVKGVLQRANAKNQNGRVYPKNILEREAHRYMGNEVKQRRALGELDHPDSSVVNLRNVSHNILEMHWDGDDLCGTVEILNTPAGNILKELFKSGITLGISSRGLGSVKTLTEADGGETVEVQPDFELITFDFVSNPSTHGAFLKPVGVHESVDRSAAPKGHERVEGLIRDIICELSGVCCL